MHLDFAVVVGCTQCTQNSAKTGRKKKRRVLDHFGTDICVSVCNDGCYIALGHMWATVEEDGKCPDANKK
jgi:hypothetical protein